MSAEHPATDMEKKAHTWAWEELENLTVHDLVDMCAKLQATRTHLSDDVSDKFNALNDARQLVDEVTSRINALKHRIVQSL